MYLIDIIDPIHPLFNQSKEMIFFVIIVTAECIPVIPFLLLTVDLLFEENK
jgi:hypothetical protein